MTRSEALEVLGLEQNATTSDIRDAWKRQLKGCHPDRGGSELVAKLVNIAKETLLDKRRAEPEPQWQPQPQSQPPPRQPPPPPEPELGLWDTRTREEEIARQQRAEREGRVRWPVRY